MYSANKKRSHSRTVTRTVTTLNQAEVRNQFPISALSVRRTANLQSHKSVEKIPVEIAGLYRNIPLSFVY